MKLQVTPRGMCNAWSALWPDLDWQVFMNNLVTAYSQAQEYGELTILGPASSGKTCFAACLAITQYLLAPQDTVVLVTSTTREMLQHRVLGQIWERHDMLKQRDPSVPGHRVPSRQAIITGDPNERVNLRGVFGVATKSGENYVGLGNFIGIKAPNVILIVDEASLMPPVFIEAVANLRNNEHFELVAMGNPLGEDNALGVLAEPETGWQSVLRLHPLIRTWKTKRGGLALQLSGLQTPNRNGETPYPYLITEDSIRTIQAQYGTQSVQFYSQALGAMPITTTGRKIITAAECRDCGALDPPRWRGGVSYRIAALDPAFSAVGGEGDRCVLVAGAVGMDASGRNVLGIESIEVVPIQAQSSDSPSDQVAEYVDNRLGELGIPGDNLWFDATTHGSLAVALTRRLGNCNAVEFGGKPPKHMMTLRGKKAEEEYGKMVSWLWFTAAEAIRGGHVRGLNTCAVEELSAREWIVTGKTAQQRVVRVDVERKVDLKKRLGRSPDVADAIAIAVHGALVGGGLMLARAASMPLPGARYGPLSGIHQLKHRQREILKKRQLLAS